MKSFRTSIVVATAAFALSLAGVSRAEDDVSSKKGTTKTQSTTKTGTSSSTTDATAPTTGAAPTDTTMPATTPSTSTDTSSGTGSDSAYGTGYGTTQPYQNQPYQQTQQQPAQQEPVQTQTTYSTTTTTDGHTVYLMSMALEPGDYRLQGVSGMANAFPFLGGFFVPLLQDVHVPAQAIMYLGRVTAKLRPRKDG